MALCKTGFTMYQSGSKLELCGNFLLQFAQKKTYQVNGKAHLHPYLHHNHNVL
jgi:hypothetical protein